MHAVLLFGRLVPSMSVLMLFEKKLGWHEMKSVGRQAKCGVNHIIAQMMSKRQVHSHEALIVRRTHAFNPLRPLALTGGLELVNAGKITSTVA
jgi:hypothetical protein